MSLEEEIARVQGEIAALRGKAHLLTPLCRTKIDYVRQGYVPTLRITSISPYKEDQEVYEVPGLPGKFSLTKVALQRLEALAGVKGWRTSSSYINDNSLKAQAVAYAKIEDIDGTERESEQTFTYDLTDDSPQCKKMKPDQIAQARANIITLAETKAMNRVRRHLLGLQSTFTMKDLEKPFVVMRLTPAPLDMSDPLVKKLMIMKTLGVTAELFDAALKTLPAGVLPQAPKLINPESVPELMEAPPNVPDPDEPPLVHDAVPPPSGREDQIRRIRVLYLDKVRGGRSANKPSLESLDDATLEQLENHLKNLPDLPF